MAEFYEADFARARGAGPIPYQALANGVFMDPKERLQRLVPFLGAGASLGPRVADPAPPVRDLDRGAVQAAIGALGFSGHAARLMELAAALAAKIEAAEGAQPRQAPPNPLDVARESAYPPSATQLAAALATLAAYDGFERPLQRLAPLLRATDSEVLALVRWIAQLTDIGPAVPPLLSVASYSEFIVHREALWRELRRIFENKTTPVDAHRLVAAAAAHHLANDPKQDYLIVTTNYDQLTEIALAEAQVPFCVLTVGNVDQHVHVDVRFSDRLQALLGKDVEWYRQQLAHKAPKHFILDLDPDVAIVFKLHGCLFPEVASEPPRDSVVLSDEDYIRFLMRMQHEDGMIPAAVTRLLSAPGFLFLGYSFSDWNVRAIYKTVVERRVGKPGDYAVVRDFSAYDSRFCQESSSRIDLLVTDLQTFVANIMAHAPAEASARPATTR